MSKERVSLRLEHLENGWAVIAAQVGDASYTINAASYVRDSLGELAASGAAARAGEPKQVLFEGEPEQWRLSVMPAPEARVALSIHWAAQRRYPERWAEAVFSAECTAMAYARAVRSAFALWDPADYEARWNHPFPRRAYDDLRDALHS